MTEAASGEASARWAAALAEWAIPPEILARAPESPFEFHVESFARAARAARADTPTRARALEALPDGGVVVDVGCGAGATSLPLASRASRIVGVDDSAEMLAAFALAAAEAGVSHAQVRGRWPECAGDVETADVVVSGHVLYNVPEIAAFARALTEHAHHRVVVEITARHPLSWTAPYWRALHGIARPERPVARDAVDALAQSGIDVNVEEWTGPFRIAGVAADDLVALMRRRLCVPASRDDDVRAALRATPPPESRAVVTLWWDV